jgi:carboxyl-terminal processing protease
MKSRKLFLRLFFLLCIILLSCIFFSNHNKIWHRFQHTDSVIDTTFYESELFQDAINIVDTNYVRPVTQKELIYGALGGMLSSLDSYSAFLSPEQYQKLKSDSLGEFGGLGIKVTLKDKILTVVSPLEGTPAYKAGIIPGDKIIAIDDNPTKDFHLDDIIGLLRGTPGTVVKLTIMREPDNSIHSLQIKRAVIIIQSIKHAFIINDNIGYIRIADFQRRTSADLGKAIRRLIRDGLRGLILDLRNNPGGLFEASIATCEKFLKKPDIIVSTKGRIKSQNNVFYSRSSRAYSNFPIVVIINKGTASASEIVAAAIRDNKRGLVLGEKSFGKGSVQTVIPMEDNSALRITTSYYYTPSGAIINEKGIMPDVVVSSDIIESEAEQDDDLETDKDPKQILLGDKQVVEAINLLHDKERYTALLAV